MAQCVALVTASSSSITSLTLSFLFAINSVAVGLTPIIPVWRVRQSFLAIKYPIGLSLSNKDEDRISWSDQSDVDVQIYDNTFSPLTCKVIHALAVENSFRVDSETSYFLRPPWNERPLTPLEHAIDSALSALNDESKLVEYWSREEYINIDAHVDVDERVLEDEEQLAVPSSSHVLYLEVNVTGPTCVFPSKRVGWGSQDEKPNSTVDLVIVPAVQGRILRFPGSAMHAVPCPADRWLMTEEDEMKLKAEEQSDDEDEVLDGFDEEGDDDIDDKEGIERSVLLFNTWPDDGPPPLSALSCGYHDERLVREWEEDYGVDAELIRCNPASDWREFLAKEATANKEESQQNQIRVNLMGNENRRVHPDQTVRLTGPVRELREALEQKDEVIWFSLV